MGFTPGLGLIHFILSEAGFFHQATTMGKPSHLTPSSHHPTEQEACMSAHESLLQVSQNGKFTRTLQKSLLCRGCEVTSSFKNEQASPQSRLLGLMQLVKQAIKPFLLYILVLGLPFAEACQRGDDCGDALPRPAVHPHPGKPRRVS